MHVHILGVCGTFMGGLALIARQLGYRVTGSDQNVYPPMSTQLEEHGIELHQGYDAAVLELKPDEIIVGNVMTRGHQVVEAMLEQGAVLMSGPEWLYRHVLHDRWVIAVSGTHGKTTTTAMITSVLRQQNLDPGYLIGGVANEFEGSARLGVAPFFVIEADEYDTAFFDKRSKFIHYRPRTLVINNLEFDHADIFDDLRAIKRQFHHMIKMLPASGKIIYNGDDENIVELLALGCWSERESFGIKKNNHWCIERNNMDVVDIEVENMRYNLQTTPTVFGEHNIFNATASIAACRHAGVDIKQSVQAIEQFAGVKRRLEHKGTISEVSIYDDFAHHPTEITATLSAFRNRFPERRLVVVFEPRSNSMQMGAHRQQLHNCFTHADLLFVLQSASLSWSVKDNVQHADLTVGRTTDELVDLVESRLQANDCVLVLSNGSFDGFCVKLMHALKMREQT